MSAATVMVAISKFKKRWNGKGRGVYRTSSTTASQGSASMSLAERERFLFASSSGGRSLSGPARRLAATGASAKKNLAPNQKPGPTQIIDEIRYLFLERDIRRQSYINLFGFLIYLALYLIVLSCQQNPAGRYDIHRSLSSLLPKDGNEEIRESFEDASAMMGYLEAVMKSDLWRDSECGNGVCEAPFETSSYGRFGCSEDCSWDQNVTNVEIHIRNNFESRGEKDITWWNVCPAGACTYENFVSEDTSCWFSEPQAFVTLLGTAVVSLYMPDGDWTFCLIAPTGGVKGEIYYRDVPLAERKAGGSSLLGFENSYTPISDANDEVVVVTAATESGVRVTQWDYCLSTKTVCEKSCDRIAGCFRWCPAPTMSFTDVKTACLAKCSSDPTKVPHPDYFTCRDSKSTALYNRESIASRLGIPLGTVPTSCGNESLVDIFAAAEADCADQCPLRFLGDNMCDEACNMASCAFDHSDCCSLDGPQPDNVACCGLFKSASRFDVVQVDFTVNNFEDEVTDDLREKPRERNIGAHNRLIAGMLLEQRRRIPGDECSGRFRLLWSTNACTKRHQEAKPYGVDPVFLRSSSLFDASRDAADYYDEDEFDNRGLGLPYGFFPIELGRDDRGAGYPVFVDINLSEERSAALYTYIADGFFIDGFTESLTLQFITYNGAMGFFGNFRLGFRFRRSGYIDIHYTVDAVRVQPYKTAGDYVRLVVEVLLVLGVLKSLFNEVLDMIYLRRYSGSWRTYFSSAWNYVDLTSIGLFVVSTVSWIRIVANCSDLNVDLRYNVYADIASPKHPPHVLQLANGGQGLLMFAAKLNDLNTINDLMTFYTFINFVNVILMLLRSLKLMDFQPRIGVVTRTLWLAASDLFHFFLLLGIIFMSYTVMTFIAFGNHIDHFSDFYRACNTNFLLLLGELEVNQVLIQQEGLTLAMAIIFFWTYEMLVFLVLLNFLLAILIDAFTEIAEDARDSASLTAEVGSILADKWRDMGQALHLRWFQHYISDKKMFGYLSRLTRDDPRVPTTPKSTQEQQSYRSSVDGFTVDNGGWDLNDGKKGNSRQSSSSKGVKYTGGLLCCLQGMLESHHVPGAMVAADVQQQEEGVVTLSSLERSLPLGPHHSVSLKELVDALQIMEHNAGIFDETQMERGNQHAMVLAQAVMSRFGRALQREDMPGAPPKAHMASNGDDRGRPHLQKKVTSGKLMTEIKGHANRLDRLEKLMVAVAKKLDVDEDVLRLSVSKDHTMGSHHNADKQAPASPLGKRDGLAGSPKGPRISQRVTFCPADDMPPPKGMAASSRGKATSPIWRPRSPVGGVRSPFKGVLKVASIPKMPTSPRVAALRINRENNVDISPASSIAGGSTIVDISSPLDSPERESAATEGGPRLFPLSTLAILESTSEEEEWTSDRS